DFATVSELGRDDARLHIQRGISLESLGRLQAAVTAWSMGFARLQTTNGPAATDLRLLYGFAVSGRFPEKARQAFAAVLQVSPDHSRALYGQAMLAEKAGRIVEAVKYFDRASEADPQFVEPRRFRAVLLARLGKIAQASQDMEWCLQREPNVGATLYAAACMCALAAEKIPQAKEQAFDFLKRALAQEYGA